MWPKELRTLFADMWKQDYTKRPSFSEVLPRLKEIRGEKLRHVSMSSGKGPAAQPMRLAISG